MKLNSEFLEQYGWDEVLVVLLVTAIVGCLYFVGSVFAGIPEERREHKAKLCHTECVLIHKAEVIPAPLFPEMCICERTDGSRFKP